MPFSRISPFASLLPSHATIKSAKAAAAKVTAAASKKQSSATAASKPSVPVAANTSVPAERNSPAKRFATFSHLRQPTAAEETRQPNTDFADRVAAARKKASGTSISPDAGSFAARMKAALAKVGRR